MADPESELPAPRPAGPSRGRDASGPLAELRQARLRLRSEAARLGAILESLGQGVSIYDARGRLVACNRQFLEIYRLPPSCARRGTTFRRILEQRVKANTHIGDDPESYIGDRLALMGTSQTSTGNSRLNSGQVIAVTHQPLAAGGWVSTHRDVTELNAIEAELAHLAYHDPLTGLPNRTLFYQRLAQAFATLPDRDGFAVLCLDLDGFKPVNDSLGHAAGDSLLKEFAARLLALLGPGDTAARMGGDEFAALLVDCSVERALEIGGRIQDAVRQPFEFDGQVATVAVGIGIARAPAHGRDVDALLHSADLALYVAKREHRGAICAFDPQMDAAAAHKRHLEVDLRRALDNGEFELFYQPLVDLKTTQMAGFEALIRWRHPERGLVPPSEFVSVAEELGLIVPIGEWAIREALAEAARWPADLRVAVNVSSIQLTRGNLVSTVVGALAATGIAHERVEIEITESVFLENSAGNLETLRQLRALGVRIALDDFGTGFSALSYLLAFPFDKIKIDGSFVRALDDSAGALTILRAVAEIGARMGMTTTAEGIETAAQLKNVSAVGYCEAQGYLISRPLSRDAARRLVLGAYDAMPEAPLLALAS